MILSDLVATTIWRAVPVWDTTSIRPSAGGAMAVALSADEQALLMQFLAEFRSLSPTHQIDICARIEQAVKPENEQEKNFFRALVRCLLDIADGPGSAGARALKARACV